MNLERAFEDKLKEAVLDDAERELDEVAQYLVDIAESNFRDYASRNGYAIEHIWQGVDGPTVERGPDGVSAEIQWPGLTALFEYGVSPHTIRGDPLLAFHWEAPPGGTRPPGAPSFVVAEEVNWGSVTGGIPESRAIRFAVEEAEARLNGGVLP